MKRTVLAILVLGLVPLVASAAPTITFHLVYNGTYSDATFNTFLGDKSTVLFGSGLNPAGYSTAWVNEFKVQISVNGMAAGQDLAKVGFARSYGTALTENAVYAATSTALAGWDEKVTITGKTSADFPIFSAPDVKAANIAVDVSNATANAAKVGEGVLGTDGHMHSPATILYLEVQWNGTAQQALQISTGAPGGSDWVMFTGNLTGTSLVKVDQPAGTETSSNSFVFGAVPEPATMALLAVGGLGLLLKRRNR